MKLERKHVGNKNNEIGISFTINFALLYSTALKLELRESVWEWE